MHYSSSCIFVLTVAVIAVTRVRITKRRPAQLSTSATPMSYTWTIDSNALPYVPLSLLRSRTNGTHCEERQPLYYSLTTNARFSSATKSVVTDGDFLPQISCGMSETIRHRTQTRACPKSRVACVLPGTSTNIDLSAI